MPLTCPDADTYYEHQGSPTSAQYYLNPIGVGPSQACIWGSAGSNEGNWAPMVGNITLNLVTDMLTKIQNLGVGQKGGLTFLSLFPNAPTNPSTAGLGFNVEIDGQLSGVCKFENGQFYTSTGTNPAGCTVSYQISS